MGRVQVNNSHSFEVKMRRERVAHYRLRGLTQREIVEAIAKDGIYNKETGKPYTYNAIHNDLKAVEKEWRDRAVGDIAELKAIHLAELREARKLAWKGNHKGPQLFHILKSLEQEAKVLGLESDFAEDLGRMADSFLAGVHTVQSMQAEDLSEQARNGA